MTVGTLAAPERRLLLALARNVLEVRLVGAQPLEEKMPPALQLARGAFVTLHLRGRLRGCIGTFRPREPLWQVVGAMATAAAFHDPRFPPVRAEELTAIEIEISALTPLQPVTDPTQIVVGRDGLYITRGSRSGVLLPQVATEWGWDREEFLEQTCRKAGLPADGWRQGATIEAFQAEVFSEAEGQRGCDPCGG